MTAACRLIIILTALTPLASAQLVFDEEEINHTAEVGDSEFVAVFSFQNQGSETIEIMKPSSSCGCTVPSLEKSNYAPGEKGEIKAVFKYGTRSGLQHKTVTVPTSNGVHELQLTVEIPKLYELDVRLLHWKKNEGFAPKGAHIQFYSDLPATLLSHTVDESIFELNYTVSEDGGTYTLAITPLADAPTQIFRTEWQFQTASGKIYSVPLFLRVY